MVELGCGTGHLTRHLVAGGHRVIATDGSEAMLDFVRRQEPAPEAVSRLVLPTDPIPSADAVVSVGHVLNYLPSAEAIETALLNAARALRPGGLLLVDLCVPAHREGHNLAPYVRVEEDWAIVTQFQAPTPDRLVRSITVFTRESDGRWVRDDEHHENVLLDPGGLQALLKNVGIDVRVASSFGSQPLPAGLVAVIGSRA